MINQKLHNSTLESSHPLLSVPVPEVFNGYTGSKISSAILPRIINLIPPHTIYIEPFIGSGAVMRNKKIAQVNIGCDLNTEIVKAWQYATHMGYTVTTAPAEEVISSYSGHGRTVFLYLDPPYPHESRKNGRLYYKHEMSTLQHENLLKLLLQCSCNCLLSSYPNELYNDYLIKWNKIEFKTTTRAGVATEALYFNYDYPSSLHEYTYIGKNKTDRQRIQRKINRWVANIDSMDPVERNALLEAINAYRISADL